jgi:transcriptional regulator with XRE-family HTH domain
MPNTAKKTLARGEGPDPVDIHVGARLRLRRNLLGLSQEQLGKASHLTFQQIQKYERGTNRMGASRLFQMGKILDVPVAWFFDDLPEDHAPGAKRAGFGEDKQASLEGEPAAQDQILHRRETADLLRAWYRITDPKQRRKIMDLIKTMGETGNAG